MEYFLLLLTIAACFASLIFVQFQIVFAEEFTVHSWFGTMLFIKFVPETTLHEPTNEIKIQIESMDWFGQFHWIKSANFPAAIVPCTYSSLDDSFGSWDAFHFRILKYFPNFVSSKIAP